MVLTSIPKKRPTSQKPESLTCESTVAPAAMAMHERDQLQRRTGRPRRRAADSRPAVVVSATVAEPWATRRIVAMTKAETISGRPRSASESDSAAPMPL